MCVWRGRGGGFCNSGSQAARFARARCGKCTRTECDFSSVSWPSGSAASTSWQSLAVTCSLQTRRACIHIKCEEQMMAAGKNRAQKLISADEKPESINWQVGFPYTFLNMRGQAQDKSPTDGHPAVHHKL
eukprot:4349236-Pleurochrysis_carterae.AAC.2